MGFNCKLKKFCFFYTFLILISLIFNPIISAEDYYADIEIDVDQSGLVTIDGVTNHPNLIISNSEIYTSKTQANWFLNITKDDIFSDFIYVLMLPKDSSINYIKSTGFIRIEENQGSLIVKGFGQNESLSILVQYKIDKSSDSGVYKLDYIFIFLIILIISIILVLTYSLIKGKKDKKDVEGPKDNNPDFKGLNKRQKEIMKLLLERKIPLTQTDIQKELNLPKAAVSRNIHRLELKGLIDKEKIGMSNLIRIKK